MKKSILTLAVVAFIGLSFTSCKKDYTCVCKTEMSGSSTTTSTTTIKDTKKNAKDKCESLSSSNGSIKTTCSID